MYGDNQLLLIKLYCYPDEDSIQAIRHACNMSSVSEFIKEKYHVSLNSDEDKKFFCDNLKDIPACFHELFGKLLKNITWGIVEEEKIKIMNDNLKLVKSFEPFDENDELEKLRFFHGQHVTMADDTTNLANAVESLMNDVKAKIENNDYLMAKFVKEMYIPKIFGKVVFKKFVKQQLSYNQEFEVSFVSYNTDFDFHDNVKVYDFDCSTKGLKFRVTKAYVGIKLSVTIS